MAPDRLKICYVVPGHDLVSTVGPTRNVLSLARALNEFADVTVAFRKVLEPDKAQDLRLLEIQPNAVGSAEFVDDASTRGMSLLQFARFMVDLWRFARNDVREFDVVLEKSWMLSGYVSNICRRRGQTAIAIENYVPNAVHAGGESSIKRLRVYLGHLLAGYFLRRVPRVIAETSPLKSAIASHWRVPAERIDVVSLGVDRELFSPIDQKNARRQLGLSETANILLYVGTLDATHDLEPLLRTLQSESTPNLELHIVGNGWRRTYYSELARQSRCTVSFHGRVAHTEVPKYISGADLCLAPYDARAFKNEELGYSTMKIPEYLSVGRPVVAVASARTHELITDDKTGFLFDNTIDNWKAFLRDTPTREKLAEMAAATKDAPLMSWRDTALAYLEIARRQHENSKANAR